MAGLDGDDTSATVYLDDLNPLNPDTDDPKSQGDNHLRFVKRTLVNTFPNITGIVTPTQTELNYVDGVTSNIQDQFAARPRRNLLINGDFEVWQRAVSWSGLTSTTYLADRWAVNPSGGTVSAQRTQFGVGYQYQHRFGMYVNVTTGADYCAVYQKIENGWVLQGKTLTFSAFMQVTGRDDLKLRAYFHNVTKAAYSASAVVSLSDHITAGAGYKNVSITFTIPNVDVTWAQSDEINLVFIPADQYSSTATTAWSITLFEAQLEIGATATSFERLSAAEGLMLCQRYFLATQSVNNWGYFYAGSLSNYMIGALIPFPTTMRTQPAVTIITAPTYSNCSYSDWILHNKGAVMRVNPTVVGVYQVGAGVYTFDAEL